MLYKVKSRKENPQKINLLGVL
jgi:hypothetical protein